MDTYQPATNGQSFTMKEGVKIYGGFAGTESNLSERNLAAVNSTILKGNGSRVIGNSSNNLTTAAVLDGFTITGGHAGNGGGMLNTNASPTIINCLFQGNVANSGGGGLFNEGSSPLIINCIFSKNTANIGGGIYNNAASSPTLINLTITGNTANSGSGMTNGSSSLIAVNCVLYGNNLSNTGGSIPDISYSLVQGLAADPAKHNPDGTKDYDLFVDADNGNYQLKAGTPCINTGNNAALPANITTDIAGNPRVISGTIDMGAYEYKPPVKWYVKPGASNTGISWSKAGDFQTVINNAGDADSVFVAAGTYQPASGQSFTMKEGVKIYGGFAGAENGLNQRNLGSGNNSILKGNNNSVIENSSNHLSAAAVLDGFTITGGNAVSGGGMSNFKSSPTIINCTFLANTTSQYGGGISNSQSSPTIINCTFVANTTGQYGGAIFNTTSSSPSITNCTFFGNTSNSYGGGIFNANLSSPIISNNVFWGNTAPAAVDIFQNDGSFTINYSYTQTAQTGTGNITGSSNPFVNSGNPAGADGVFGTTDDGLVLTAGSTAINAGDPQTNNTGYAVQAGKTDIAGFIRITGGRIDMGAYESLSALPVTLANYTAYADGRQSKLKWTTATEFNNREFIILRSADGNDFTEIGRVASAGNSNTLKDYVFYDTNPVNGANYYRLQQTDYDGRITQLGVRVVNFSFANTVIVYPNPVRNTVQVAFAAGQYRQLELTDINGKVLQRLLLSHLDTQKKVDMGSVSSGIYFIKLAGDNGVESRKIIKE